MSIEVNGERREVPPGSTVRELLELMGLAKAACAVEVNKAVVPKRQHAERRLGDGDKVEVVTLVGGG